MANHNLVDFTQAVADYVDSGDAGETALLRDTVGWTGKNIAPITNTFPQTASGITTVLNFDESITCTGDMTANVWTRLSEDIRPYLEVGKSYRILSGTEYDYTGQGPCIQMGYDAQGGLPGKWHSSYQSKESRFTVTADDMTVPIRYRIGLRASEITNPVNVTMWPMIKVYGVGDDTFEPYHDNAEVVFDDEMQAIQNQINDKGKLGAKNIGQPLINMAITGNSETGFGITSSNNSLSYIANIEPGKSYTVTKKSGSGNRFRVVLFKNYPSSTISQETTQLVHNNNLNKYTFTNATYHYAVFTASYEDGNDLTAFEGMICLASDPDDTYVPYTMTNKELTDRHSAVAYGETTTAAGTATKVVTISDPDWRLRVGGIIVVGFENKNSSSTMNLNVNNTGAKEVHHMGSAKSGMGSVTYAKANTAFMYDGTYWRLLGTTYSSSYS